MEKNNIQAKKDISYGVKSSDMTSTVKDVDTTKLIVTGIFNTYNYFDSDYDVLLPGCSAKSINERGPNSTAVAKIKHLFAHKWDQLPGKIQVLEEKTLTVNNQKITGIYFETRMDETTLGNDLLIQYINGTVDNHSVGFRFLDGEYIDADSEDWNKMIGSVINYADIEKAGFAYFWKEIMLWEGSTVAFGANSLTPNLGVKGENKEAYLLRVNERINRLQSVVKSSMSDESIQTYEMELKQLRQIIAELFVAGPSIRPTLGKQGPGKKDDAMMIGCDSCGNSFDAQNMTPDEDGAYACPDCNQLCMPGTKASSIFSKLQII